jgi:hypothetical protein
MFVGATKPPRFVCTSHQGAHWSSAWRRANQWGDQGCDGRDV